MNNSCTNIIAEAGVNHNGDIKLALQLIDAAVEAGADAVKFQTFRAEKLVSSWAPKAEYQKHNTGNTESQYEILKKLELSFDDHFILKSHCKKNHIVFLSTPFDSVSADFLLNTLKLKTIKISSGEITTAPLLLQIARYEPNIILSTGMSTLGEIEEALAVLAFGLTQSTEKPSKNAFMKAYASESGQAQLKKKVTLLHCTSNYPAQFNCINLRAMDTLQSAFNLPVGYSDHSIGIIIPIAAVARGATVIEKHFTLDKSLPGPDHPASLEPDELKEMVEGIRVVERAMGNSIKFMTSEEIDTKNVARKSLIATRMIKRGELFVENNIGIMRPGTGIPAMHYWRYIGKKATRKYQIGELIDG